MAPDAGQSGEGKPAKGKAFFFEKKKQKTFMSSATTGGSIRGPVRFQNNQKFFGSFDQKRTASFLS
jgi:hypothetical protein